MNASPQIEVFYGFMRLHRETRREGPNLWVTYGWSTTHARDGAEVSCTEPKPLSRYWYE